MFCVLHIHEAFSAVRAEFSFTKTIGALSRNMSDMMDEGDIPDILLSQIAEMMEYEAKAPNISHMDFVYDEIDDITLSQVCQAMENEHSVLEGLNFMTLTQTVQSYELEFSDEYFAESMEYSVEKIPKAAVAASNGTVLRDITEKSVFQNCHIAFNFR
jgi:hypothetical protein